MSVWISAVVERVWKVFPQAHFTVAVAYSGWISVFTGPSVGFRGQPVNLVTQTAKRQADKGLPL